tara:strand:+ start:368 stop:658 length:291 start_codon:yes stop_codon:yes gene_type:complete
MNIQGKICTSTCSQAKGLMFSRKKTLIFAFPNEKTVRLHMLFVFFPIWAYVLDVQQRVVEVHKLLPFTFFTSRSKGLYVVESPEPLSVNIGEEIIW